MLNALSTADLLILAGAVVAAALMSGIFGSSGGTLLLGTLMLRLDVSTSMIVFSVSQMSANIWRCAMWIRHVHWSIFIKLTVGSIGTSLAFTMVAYKPDKAVVYLLLGTFPLLMKYLPKTWIPDISRPGAPYLCGSMVMAVLILAGASGGLLDNFFQQSDFSRKTVVATKAAAQVVTLAIRFFFFGAISVISADELPYRYLLGAVTCSLMGVLMSGIILNRMTDRQFRNYASVVLSCVGAAFFGRGLWLLSR